MEWWDTLFGSGTPRQAAAVPSGRYRVVLRRTGDRKIGVIKVIREASGFGLREAKALADRPPSVVFGTNDAVAADRVLRELERAGAEAEVQGGSEAGGALMPLAASVRLHATGPNLIAVIKAVRHATGVGLADAKRLVESAPVVVAGPLSREAALELLIALTDMGADAEILDGAPPGG